MINYTYIGEEYTKGNEKTFEKIFKSVNWQPIKENETFPLMQGMALQKIITKMRKKPIRYSINNIYQDRFEIIGVEFEYSNAIVKSYWLDDGCQIVCLASEPNFKQGGKK